MGRYGVVCRVYDVHVCACMCCAVCDMCGGCAIVCTCRVCDRRWVLWCVHGGVQNGLCVQSGVYA